MGWPIGAWEGLSFFVMLPRDTEPFGSMTYEEGAEQKKAGICISFT